ncbi:hypothetical protein J5X84_06465 [Streptosporangiaceae bacterium NEAU-GS5]|nr:hypothetical protein [Streptosporangiaceae bacterium NEAU-GS5]
MPRVKCGPAARRTRVAGIFAVLCSLIVTVVGPAAPASALVTTVCALSADGTAVYRYDGASWIQLGRAANRLYGNEFGLFAQTDTGFVRYLGTPFNWQSIGSSSNATWAVSQYALYRLSADRSSVWQWGGSPDNWIQLGGGPAGWMYGAAATVYTTTPDGQGIRYYAGQGTVWRDIPKAGAGGAADLAYSARGGRLYAIDSGHHAWLWSTDILPDGGWVQSFNGQEIIRLTDTDVMYGVRLDGSLMTASGIVLTTPTSPFPISDANVDVTLTGTGIYAASPQRDSVWRWTRKNQDWVKISDLATRQLVACP